MSRDFTLTEKKHKEMTDRIEWLLISVCVLSHSLFGSLQGICFPLHEALVWAGSWWLRDICRWCAKGRSVQATCADPHRSHEPGEKKGLPWLFRFNYITCYWKIFKDNRSNRISGHDLTYLLSFKCSKKDNRSYLSVARNSVFFFNHCLFGFIN